MWRGAQDCPSADLCTCGDDDVGHPSGCAPGVCVEQGRCAWSGKGDPCVSRSCPGLQEDLVDVLALRLQNERSAEVMNAVLRLLQTIFVAESGGDQVCVRGHAPVAMAWVRILLSKELYPQVGGMGHNSCSMHNAPAPHKRQGHSPMGGPHYNTYTGLH